MALKRRSVESNNNKETSNIIPSNLVDGQEYEGRLVYVADLGLQERNFKGEEKPPAQQISLGIEIIGEVVEYEDGETKPKLLWTQPFYIYGKMSEKGKEFAYYKIFEPTAKEKEDADWDAQLGKPCNVIIKQVEKEDVTYDNIGSLAPIPRKYHPDIAEAITEPMVGDADDPENKCTKSLFGLARWIWDRRLNEDVLNSINNEQEEPNNYSDEVPF